MKTNPLFHGQIVVVKIGGSMMDDEAALTGLCAALASLWQEGKKVVLVHGGGKDINRHLAWLQEEPLFKQGLRVTSLAALKVVEMTLSGYVNKKLVGLLNLSLLNLGLLNSELSNTEKSTHRSAKAVGISGVDGMTFQCERISDDLGQVGRITSVNTALVETLLAGNFLPIVSPISVDGMQSHFNVNADDAAAALAIAVQAEKLLFVSDVEGVRDAESKRIPELNDIAISALIEAAIASGGMIPKLNSCRAAVAAGIGQVHICGWTDARRFAAQVRGDENSGTIIRP